MSTFKSIFLDSEIKILETPIPFKKSTETYDKIRQHTISQCAAQYINSQALLQDYAHQAASEMNHVLGFSHEMNRKQLI